MTYFLDANIISYLMKGNETILRKMDSIAENGSEIAIPSSSCYEIKRGLILPMVQVPNWRDF